MLVEWATKNLKMMNIWGVATAVAVVVVTRLFAAVVTILLRRQQRHLQKLVMGYRFHWMQSRAPQILFGT